MLVSAVLLGLFAGIAAGGDLRRLMRVRVRAMPLLFGAGALRLLGFVVALPVAMYASVLAVLVVVAFLNRQIPGVLLAMVGIALNLMVISLNGGMPVDVAAAQAAGVEVRDDGLHVPLTGATVLSFLADTVPAPPFRNVYSLGDILLAGGGFWIMFGLLRRRN